MAFATPKRLFLMLLVGSLSTPSLGGSLTPIRNDLKSGNHHRALSEVSRIIKRDPDNYAARLLHAEVLDRLGRQSKAEQELKALIENQPQRVEAYNNLAVIYADQGRLDEASQTLEQGIRSHRTYATLHSNLAEIYAKMAQEAYGKAQVIKSGAAKPKLATLLDVETAASHGRKVKAPSQAAMVIAANTATPTLPVTELPTPKLPVNEKAKPAPKITKRREVQETEPGKTEGNRTLAAFSLDQSVDAGRSASPQTEEPELIPSIPKVAEKRSTTKPPKPQTVALAKPAKPDSAPRKAAAVNAEGNSTVGPIRRLLGWARAWSRKDADGYVDFYSRAYRPSGMSRTAWVKQRRSRIKRPEWIKVDLTEFRAKPLSNGKVQIDFRQVYKSNRFNSKVRKRVVMVNEGEGWVIASERVTARE